MRPMKMALVGLLAVAPAIASAAPLAAGSTCELTAAVGLKTRPAGKRNFFKARIGETVTIEIPRESWTRVKVRGQVGFMSNEALARYCEPAAASAGEAPAGTNGETPAGRSGETPAGTSGETPAGTAAGTDAGASGETSGTDATEGAMADPSSSSSAAVEEATAADPSAPIEGARSPPAEPAGGSSDREVASPAARPAPSTAEPERNDDLASAFANTYKIKVAVMTLTASQNVEPELVVSLTNAVPEALEALGPFAAVSSEEVKQLLIYESQKQMIGCAEEACVSELGGALGADFMVSGSITRVGETWIIQLQLMNVDGAKVEQRVSREYLGSTEGLFESMRAATKQLVREILGQRSGRLRVQVSEEGATISVNGSIVGVSPMLEPLTLAGGNHTIAVEKTGFVVFRKDYAILEDRVTEAGVTLLPSAEYVEAYRARAGLLRTFAWIGIGAGAAALATSAILFGASDAQANELNADIAAFNDGALRTSDEHDLLAAEQRAVAGFDVAVTVTFIVGIATAATGVLLYLLGDDPGRYDDVMETSVGVTAALSLGPGLRVTF